MDFLKPTIETVSESLRGAWVQLPPPVQQAAPYVGVAMGSGIVVYAVQQRRLNQQRERSAELQLQVTALHKERHELLRRVNTLKVKQQHTSCIACASMPFRCCLSAHAAAAHIAVMLLVPV